MENDYYEQFCIRRFQYWSVYVHEQQHYLGRVYIWANRDGFIDIFDCSLLELFELVTVATKVRTALTQLFAPDMFNYAALGNEAPHCHLHVIPRYRSVRSFAGEEFYDGQWGKNYAPYPKDRELTNDQLYQLRDALKALI